MANQETVERNIGLSFDFLTTEEDIKQVEVKMAQMEARLTMRMFYFWLGQVAVIAGMLAYFFHVSK